MFERFTERARQVVVLAQEEARTLKHNYIGTEHILLGLIREGEGVAAQVLVKLGADLNRVRQQVLQLLSGYQGKEPAEGEQPKLYILVEGDTEVVVQTAMRELMRLLKEGTLAAEQADTRAPTGKYSVV